MTRCFSCFKEFEEQYEVCPHCGNLKNLGPKEPIYLAPGTVLLERYLLGETVNAGGFGIIYKAWDIKLETVVAVKEFFASRLMTRAGGSVDVIVNKKSLAEFSYRKARFLAEARNMAKFGTHKNIPNVFEFFEENGTAYIVMELLEGKNLKEYRPDVGGKLEQGFALFIINEVGKALSSLHEKGIIHRDVAPDNIFICSEKELRIKLLDFGAAKLTDETDDVIDIVLKPGYSPAEQYDVTKNIGPWSDVYALGATLYEMLTGIKPDESTNRKEEDNLIQPCELDKNISENLSNAIMKAMAVEKHMRFKTVAEFLKAINGEKKVITLKKEKKRRKFKQLTGIAVACLVLATLGNFVYSTYNDKKSVQVLPDASISLWFSLDDGSTEEAAIQSIVDDFTGKFPNVNIEVRAIPADEYEDKLREAIKQKELPTVFESTELTDDMLSDARDITNVLESEQADKCNFLNQYRNYYSDFKRIPLGIEVPMAYVITNGAASVDYTSEYFSSYEDFGSDTKISIDEDYISLIEKNAMDVDGLLSKSEFMNNESNSSAVMLSSSMILNKVKETLTNYQKSYVFYDSDAINCEFVYEWSIGTCSASEAKVAERLLSWMLGNAYQNTLMISMCSDGQIPVNCDCFIEKTNQKNLKAIQDIYQKFVF